MSAVREFTLTSPSRRRVGEKTELDTLFNRNRAFEELIEKLLTPENRRRGIQCPILDLLRKYQTAFQLGTLPYDDDRRAQFKKRLEGIGAAEKAFINRFVEPRRDPVESSLQNPILPPPQVQSRLHNLLGCMSRRT